MAKPKIVTTSTIQPDDPQISYASPKRKLSLDERQLLSTDLMNGMIAGIAARAALDRNLDDWEKLFEMELDPQQNEPWDDASNICVPIIPAQLETALAYIAARTLVPRFFIVSGNTQDAQPHAYLIERYYNTELVRQRGSDTWFEELISWLNKSFHGGTSIMEAVWVRKKTRRTVKIRQPVQNDGVPVIDQDNMQQRYEYVEKQIEETLYDDVRLQALKLKDFGVLPATAPSINEAAAVWRKMFLYEGELLEMIEAGTLWADAVERSLSYVESGSQDGISTDIQGVYDKTTGKQVNPYLSQGSHNSPFFRNRGPVLVYRIHSREYDMDGDGICEENIFYYDYLTQELLGWMPYDYPNPHERPFFEYSWAPREDQFAGYSFIERLTALVGQINKMNNDRNNAVDLRIDPPLFIPTGTELHDGEQTWAPGVMWEGTAKPEVIQLSDIPLASSQEESLLMNYVTQVTGQGQPMIGAQSSGRRSASEVKTQAASTGTRNDLVAIRFRVSCRALFNFVHRLKLQYTNADIQGTDNQGQLFTISPEIMGLDYRLDVSGATDPVDAQSRLNQDMGIYQLLMQNPLVMQDPMKMFAITRKVLESAGYSDVDTLIGTKEQLEQILQKQQQAAQQAAAHGQPPPGQHPQNNQQQHAMNGKH
jgi:hypothetical protein